MADSGKQYSHSSLAFDSPISAGQNWRKLIKLSVVLLLLGFVVIKLLPVRYVRIEGELRQVDPVALQAVLEPLLESGYLRVDLNAVEAAAHAQPWVGEVTVKRLWPETLVIRVEELTAYARMEDGSFVSEKGVRFFAGQAISTALRTTAPCHPAEQGDCSVGLTAETAKLPLLRGPDGYEKPMLAMLKTMNAKLLPLGRHIVELQLSTRRAWTIKLEDGLVVTMGRQDVLTAFERFLTLAGLLGVERLQVVQRVDFRYPNGCAVSMKPKTELKLGG